MTESERVELVGLPEPVPVFRGFSRDGGEHGFAWTLDRDRAEWFAGFHDGPRIRLLYGQPDGAPRSPRVAVGKVAKSYVIAYICDRQESEVLVLPETVVIEAIEPV
jgi:hypothetical protein